jgi:TonB family protein
VNINSCNAILVTIAVSAVAVVAIPAQNATGNHAQKTVVLTKLFQPIYPPLAGQLQIAGDVEVKIKVRKDGSVESAKVVSGHVLLRQVALESAQRSEFECRNCGDGLHSFRMFYSFRLGPPGYCVAASESPSKENEQPESYTQVTASQNRIVVIGQQVGNCDPGIGHRKMRSARCLYLWKCGLQ